MTLYNVVRDSEHVFEILTFFKACRLNVSFIKYYNGNRSMLHTRKKLIETKR